MTTANLEAVRAFVTIVEQGSFSAAAKVLAVSKSMLSRQVSALEEDLGMQLLFRTTRHLRTTEAGMFYFVRCQRALQDMIEAQKQVSDYNADVRGSLRVLATDIFGEEYIAPALSRCMLDYPSLCVELEISSDRRDLISDNYDFVICYGDLQDSNILATKIFDLPHIAAATPNYIANFGNPRSLADRRPWRRNPARGARRRSG